MIIKNTDGRDEEINHDNKYKQIHEINLSKKNIINFKNKKNVSFEKLQDLYILNLSENIKTIQLLTFLALICISLYHFFHLNDFFYFLNAFRENYFGIF